MLFRSLYFLTSPLIFKRGNLSKYFAGSPHSNLKSCYNCRIAINSVNASDVSLEGSDGVGAVRVAACFGVSGICMNKVGMPKLSRW